jgi:hypothetical protein
LERLGSREVECREALINALVADPSYQFGEYVFFATSSRHPEDWTKVLPTLAQWSAENPGETTTYHFVIEGFIRYARAISTTAAIKLLDDLPDSTPFETLRDAFRAHEDIDHLNRLSPERRAIAIELLQRLKGEPTKAARPDRKAR